MEGFAGLILFARVLEFVLVICWILLPFAMIGIKPLFGELVQEQRKTNKLLAKSNSGEAPEIKRESWPDMNAFKIAQIIGFLLPVVSVIVRVNGEVYGTLCGLIGVLVFAVGRLCWSSSAASHWNGAGRHQQEMGA